MIISTLGMTDKEQDRSLQAAMKRRAAQVPPLANDFPDRVMERMKVESEGVKSEKYKLHFTRKVAAIFLAAIFLSGLAFATYLALSPRQTAEEPELSIANYQLSIQNETDTLKTDTAVTNQPVVFDNVPLEKMLPEMAAHYQTEVEFLNDGARQLRFHFVWKREEGLDRAIEKLNRFESLTIRHEADWIIVE